MEWAVVLEGRSGPEAVLLIVASRREAESLAAEIRKKGPRVVVEPYPAPGYPKTTVLRP